jgi:ferredoxin-NADP reductase
MIAPKVRHLAFAREDNEPLAFTAGQFITLHVQGPTKILHRSYSIANIPGKDNTIELACSYVEGGLASGLLFGLQPGDSISASGPYGLFILKDEKPSRYILIATGTGVTPYRSMLNEIEQRLKTTASTESPLEVILVSGVRNPEELLYGEEFIAFANANPQFKFKAFYSREVDRELKSFESKGHVQDTFADLKLNPAQDIVYLCGNPSMIDDSFTLLTELGFDRKNVRREKYLFSH